MSKQSTIKQGFEEFIEKGADLEHKRWAKWQEYIFDCAIRSGDDNLGIRTFAWPTGQVENWERQIETPYEELPEKEKESDRKETREYLPLIKQMFLSLANERIESLRGRMKKTIENMVLDDPLFEEHGIDGIKGNNSALSEEIKYWQNFINQLNEIR